MKTKGNMQYQPDSIDTTQIKLVSLTFGPGETIVSNRMSEGKIKVTSYSATLSISFRICLQTLVEDC